MGCPVLCALVTLGGDLLLLGHSDDQGSFAIRGQALAVKELRVPAKITARHDHEEDVALWIPARIVAFVVDTAEGHDARTFVNEQVSRPANAARVHAQLSDAFLHIDQRLPAEPHGHSLRHAASADRDAGGRVPVGQLPGDADHRHKVDEERGDPPRCPV